MPFLEFARLSGGPLPARILRGTQPEFWESIEEMRRIATVAGLTRLALPSSLLNVGACPGLWRVYYTAIAAVPDQRRLPAPSGPYLGRESGAATADALGTQLEEWVEEANHAMNQFLESHGVDWGPLDRISTDGLREYYRQRAQELVRAEDLDSEPHRFRMTIPALIRVFPDLPFSDMTPDGMFEGRSPGAIFESKLSDPGENLELRSRMAAYAVAAERATGHEFDRGIVLHSNYPQGELRARSIVLSDVDVQRVRTNLGKLRQLFRISWVRWRSSPHGRGSGSRPQTWRQLLARPTGERPTTRRQGACSDCEFRDRCWQEGGWNRARTLHR